jgi:hypothetical protein
VSRSSTTAWVAISAGLAAAAWVASLLLFWDESTFPITQIILAVPIAVAVSPLLFRSGDARQVARGIAAGLLVFFCLITGFSVGFLYLPSAIATLIATVIGGAAPARPSIPPPASSP